MLKTLSIRNYALIDALDVTFDAGLTIITGETGAGKSIILGALSLIMGERASAQSMGDPSRKTTVEASFDISDYQLASFFEENDLDYVADECCLRRELTPNGRSRAFVNDTPVPLGVLRSLATRLVDIHSQHANLLLADRSFQVGVLDAISCNEDVLSHYVESYNHYRQLQKELAEATDALEQSRAEEDYLRFQYDQLVSLRLEQDEDVTMEQKQKRLANAASLKEQLWTVCEMLDNDNESLLGQLNHIVSRLQQLEPYLQETAGMHERVNTSLIELKDIHATLLDLEEDLDVNPDELERIDARLAEIYNLERKHRVVSVNELLALQQSFAERLNGLEHGQENIARLEQEVHQAEVQARKWATQLTAMRQEAAKDLSQRLVSSALPLGLPNLKFSVSITPAPLGPMGCDQVEFLMAFNKNQPMVPVQDTASGGEISRVMLCLKAIVASAMHLPSIIFDEVDTGVSGDIANRIGEMMADIGRKLQVIAITHLPQVAAHGATHLLVYKNDINERTVTNLRRLTEQEHVAEVARMLSGRSVDRAAIENAQSLINQTTKR